MLHILTAGFHRMGCGGVIILANCLAKLVPRAACFWRIVLAFRRWYLARSSHRILIRKFLNPRHVGLSIDLEIQHVI